MSNQNENPLDPIRKAQEDDYFYKQNKELAAKLKNRLALESAGVKDPELADQLGRAGYDADSIRALFLFPLVEVAWADNEIQPEEKKQIMALVTERGIEPSSRAHRLVETWIEKGKEDSSFSRARTLLEPLLVGISQEGAAWILEASNRVASAAGGVFGLGWGSKTSANEEKILKDLAARIAPKIG